MKRRERDGKEGRGKSLGKKQEGRERGGGEEEGMCMCTLTLPYTPPFPTRIPCSFKLSMISTTSIMDKGSFVACRRQKFMITNLILTPFINE